MTRLYTLTSDLHAEMLAAASEEPFIKEIEALRGERFEYCGSDYTSYGSGDDVIYVRTGGTEGLFRKEFCKDGKLSIPGGRKIRLLTSGKSNSLAASMEILSFLRINGYPGRIIHGSAAEIVAQMDSSAEDKASGLVRDIESTGILEGQRYGVVGRPSDWLISSDVDYAKVKAVLGAELVDIPIEELISLVNEGGHRPENKLRPMNEPKYGRKISQQDFDTALEVYGSLKLIIDKYKLDGLALRCFDLLGTVKNTGCLALAMLNAEGYVATCEGDLPTMLTMAVGRAVSGVSGFQVNLSRIADNNFLFAHCTVPLDMVEDYCYDTHFESGIGVAIHGTVPVGPATIFKLSADMEHYMVKEVSLESNAYGDSLCRTQVIVKAEGLRSYMLAEPLGNHHVILPGSKSEVIGKVL